MGPIAFFKHLKNIIQSRPQVSESVSDNALLKIILNRRSIRSFSEKEIPYDVFNAVLEAGRLAPSTVNLQTWSFFVFSPQEWEETFERPIPFRGNRAVIICGDAHRNKPSFSDFPDSPLVEYTVAVMNASLAAMNMNIAAEALGISSVMLSETGRSGFFAADYLIQKLSLPEGVFPLMTIVFGYAKGGYPPMPPKLPYENLFFKTKYKETPAKILDEWYNRMVAGFKATFPLKTFKGQLKNYRKNIENAEKTLQKIVFPLETPQAGESEPGKET